MLRNFSRRHHSRILRNEKISFTLWREVCQRSDLLSRLDASERARLRMLTTLFLHEKSINGVQGLVLNREMEVIIAAQACVLILNLSLEHFAGWVEVVVYPDTFRVPVEVIDDNGLQDESEHALDGEAWQRGPVILSWAGIAQDLEGRRAGHNLILHEFSHKLDMLNGRANGLPPLHPEMDLQRWTETLSQAFTQLQDLLSHSQQTCIDGYAATSPAEFFAVVSEYFFTAPHELQQYCDGVYEQLCLYYRQNPLSRYASSP